MHTLDATLKVVKREYIPRKTFPSLLATQLPSLKVLGRDQFLVHQFQGEIFSVYKGVRVCVSIL